MIDYLAGWLLGVIVGTAWTAVYYHWRYPRYFYLGNKTGRYTGGINIQALPRDSDLFEPDGSPSPEQGLNNNAPERSDKQDNENH
jgi:hypothetical protein